MAENCVRIYDDVVSKDWCKETIEYLMTGKLPNDGNHDGMAHHKPVKHGNLDALD